MDRALDGAELVLADVLRKSHFWNFLTGESLNDRQRNIIEKLLDRFEGNLAAIRWAVLQAAGAPAIY